MKAILIQPKDRTEMNFINGLMKKLGISTHPLSAEEMEDIGMGFLMKEADRSQKVSRESVMRKLKS